MELVDIWIASSGPDQILLDGDLHSASGLSQIVLREFVYEINSVAAREENVENLGVRDISEAFELVCILSL